MKFLINKFLLRKFKQNKKNINWFYISIFQIFNRPQYSPKVSKILQNYFVIFFKYIGFLCFLIVYFKQLHLFPEYLHIYIKIWFLTNVLIAFLTLIAKIHFLITNINIKNKLYLLILKMSVLIYNIQINIENKLYFLIVKIKHLIFNIKINKKNKNKNKKKK
jgi:hypothetical protein